MWTSDEFVGFGGIEGGGEGHPEAPDGDQVQFTPIAFDSLTAIDTDGDGIFETMIVQDGDDLTLVYDLDGDGLTDFQTEFKETGEPMSWRDERDEDGQWHWRRVDGS
ncbi:DUF6802 family protein [Tomitella biformata]|uniref:DUF6802 family protein n=1 Tax=Tomitella biformata TaxID=630403 RepID=UPI0004668399|nr:DUF6802 family protein [Tomitella biformata]